MYKPPIGKEVNNEPDYSMDEKMFVQLDLSSNISLRRAFFDKRNVCEHSIIQNKIVTPLTQEEYKERIAHLNLNIGEFCLYQDKLM